jgi:hypothetical protein
MKWVWLPGVFLMSAVLAGSAPAQERQRQKGEQQKQQSQTMRANHSSFPNDMLEDLIVIRLADRSSLTRVIKVHVRDGVATLSGKVPSEAAERRALRIARLTPGVLSVRDEISVDPSMASSAREPDVGEKELAKQVAQKIASSIEGAKADRDWWFEGWRVEGRFNTWNLIVDVEDPGFVKLDGEVPSLDIMRKAVEAAAQVPGVRAVDTDLELERFYARYYLFGYPYYPPYYPSYAFHPYFYPPPASGRPSEQ